VPALVLAFAAAPIAGQNFGARNWARVRETFRVAVLYGAVVMSLLTLIVQWQAESLARVFHGRPCRDRRRRHLLTYLSWNFIPAVVTFTCSSLFQAMGNTWPAFGASAIRIVIFVVPALLDGPPAVVRAAAHLHPVGCHRFRALRRRLPLAAGRNAQAPRVTSRRAAIRQSA
jgi:Na+-driven multidrug efflux pump